MTARAYKFNEVQAIRDDGIKYAVTVGRRQPMHIMHADSLREIINEGFIPIYIVGSVNTYRNERGEIDRLYDPISNPLTYEQQKEQLFAAFPEFLTYNPRIAVFPFPDIGNLSLWSEKLCDLLKNGNLLAKNGINEPGGILEKSVLHFRGKQKDRKNINIKIPSAEITMTNVWDISALREFGLAIWHSKNPREEQYKINSSELRTTDIDSPKAKNIAAYDYIRGLIIEARNSNPDKSLLEKNKIPLTMLDISLKRLHEEVGITPCNTIKKCLYRDVDNLKMETYSLLKKILSSS